MSGSLRSVLFLLSILGAGLHPLHATCFPAHLALTRGDFSFFHFFFKPTATQTVPKALVIFGSGASGWGGFEDRVGDKLQATGYEVIGINCEIYGHSDYTVETLQADFQKLAQAYLAPYGPQAPPVVLGGWSSGAEQAVAAAAGPHPPVGLAGLLLIAPGSEGGLGRYATSYVLLTAPADKVFHLADLAPHLSHLRIAQWHAQYDLLDSTKWLSSLKAEHREYDFPNAIHDFRTACDDFLTQMSASVDWILATPKSGPKPPASVLPPAVSD